MKNFWHIQLHPNNQSEFPRDKVRRILEETQYIGMGEWDEGKVYIDQFTNVMKTGDIVLVRSKGPLALVEVIGEAEKTPNSNVEFDWFENRRLVKVLQFFDEAVKDQIGKKVDGTFNPVTFASANTSEFIKKWYSFYSKTNMLNQAKTLLEYKKQIILQGPPGTGKTRLAKEIAQSLTSKKSKFDDNEIKRLIHSGLVIPSSTDYTHYTVLAVGDNWVQVQLKNIGSIYKISFKDIKNAFQVKLWEGGQKNGSDPYAAAIAKYIFNNLSSEFGESKLIQFHPAYSYEDFVRGIIVETEDVPKYRSVNKIFATIAQKAWKNYVDSQKEPEELSKEKQLGNFIDEFKEELSVKIEESEEGKLVLKGTSTYLFQVEDDAVRYVGDNWNRHSSGLRLLFSDIKTLYKINAKNRKDILSNPDISSLARSHASYTLRVLDLFKEFMKGKSLEVQIHEKEDLKSYVLIIDEINRANLPSVLGELIYGLEYRGESVESMYEVDGSRSIIVPPNLFIIGTMNTADRSVGHIDYAIRRRFAFVDVLPSIEPIKNESAKQYFKMVSELFVSNYEEVMFSKATPIRSACLASDFGPEQVWIGHSYFITEKEGDQGNAEIRTKIKYEILPLIKEYVKDGILNSNEKDAEDPVQKVVKSFEAL